MVDNFSRFTMVKRLRKETGEYVLQKFLSSWVAAFGVPQSLYCDAGTSFIHSDWIEWSDLYGTALAQATARNQWQNGMAKRSVSTIKSYIRHYLQMNKIAIYMETNFLWQS